MFNYGASTNLSYDYDLNGYDSTSSLLDDKNLTDVLHVISMQTSVGHVSQRQMSLSTPSDVFLNLKSQLMLRMLHIHDF